MIKLRSLYELFYGIKKSPSFDELYFGAQRRNRTTDTGIFSPLLYLLSYLGIHGGPSGTRTPDLPVMSRAL